MLVTTHVLSGALIGAVTRKPLPALLLGVASHFVLDAAPHWGGWANPQQFLRVAVPDGLAGLAAIGIVTAATPPQHRLALLAGMAGAAAPDLDKPARLWFGRSPWPAAVNRFHAAIQHESPDRFRAEMIVMATLAAVLAAVRGQAAVRVKRPSELSGGRVKRRAPAG